ncbi:MAG: toll/interleukin-1 receptor domain-containing protein [Clostridia bacterium]|nr:toll/interleukin-1 receptor domain-containing protein [Clostridia bacterium]
MDKWDLFISYAQPNKDIANYVVEKIEKRGYKCFIAPRDITLGNDYAGEIIKGISNCTAVLLVYSEHSDRSGYVLREVNSAVSRNKTIIPLRIENFVPSEAMEFYLGVTQWLDAYPRILDVHLDDIISIFTSIQNRENPTKSAPQVVGPALLGLDALAKIGYTPEKVIMKEIELDYICIPQKKFIIDEEIEGTFDDWITSAIEYEADTSALMVCNDEIVGYCDFYPVSDEAYQSLISGEKIIRDSMIEIYDFGGTFDAYIAMIAITPEYASQKTYMMFIDWIFQHMLEWKKRDIQLRNIGISVYSDMLEKFVVRLGFEFKGYNPANGKIYETSTEKLFKNAYVQKRYGDLYGIE